MEIPKAESDSVQKQFILLKTTVGLTDYEQKMLMLGLNICYVMGKADGKLEAVRGINREAIETLKEGVKG